MSLYSSRSSSSKSSLSSRSYSGSLQHHIDDRFTTSYNQQFNQSTKHQKRDGFHELPHTYYTQEGPNTVYNRPFAIPRLEPRVKPEGLNNYLHANDGTIDTVIRNDDGLQYTRCASALNLYQGTDWLKDSCAVKECLGKGTAPHLDTEEFRSPNAVARVKPEALDIALSHKGDHMTDIFHNYGKEVESTKSRSSATENFDGYAGSSAHLDTEKFLSPNPIPRVKPEASHIADNHSGQGALDSVHKYGQPYFSRPPAPKVNQNARDIHENHRGAVGLLFQLQGQRLNSKW